MTPLPFKWQCFGRSVDTLLWWTGELSPLFGSESKCNVRFSSRGDFNQLPELGKALLFHYLLNSTKFNLTLGRLTLIQSSSQWLVSHIALMMASGAPLMWSCLFTETFLQARFASAQQNSEKMVCGLTASQPTCCPKCCLWSFSPSRRFGFLLLFCWFCCGFSHPLIASRKHWFLSICIQTTATLISSPRLPLQNLVLWEITPIVLAIWFYIDFITCDIHFTWRVVVMPLSSKNSSNLKNNST